MMKIDLCKEEHSAQMSLHVARLHHHHHPIPCHRAPEFRTQTTGCPQLLQFSEAPPFAQETAAVFEARLFEPVLRHAMRADKRVQSHQTDMKDFKDLQGISTIHILA